MCEKVASLLCLLLMLSAVDGLLLYCPGAVLGGVSCEWSRRAWAGLGVDVVVDCWCGRGSPGLDPRSQSGSKARDGGR